MKTLMLAEEGSRHQAGFQRWARIIAADQFGKHLLEERNETLWMTASATTLRHAFSLLEADVFKQQSDIRKHNRIFLFGEAPSFSPFFSMLDSLFKDPIILPKNSSLPIKEVLEVMKEKHPEDYVVGGQVESEASSVSLVRGDLSRLVLPLSTFKQSGEGISPEFSKFTLDDYGQTLKFGDYEASVDSVLYEFDPIYRKRKKADLRQKDNSFGACLRRLRLQKGMNQSDFSIDEREIGRIERGEVKPRPGTIKKIAKDLKVKPGEIKTY